MKQKKIMLLGRSHYLLPAIEAAHKLSVYVITCNYQFNSIAYQMEWHR